MPLPATSILEVKLQYEVFDAECTNVFWYGSTASQLPCSAASLANKFRTNVVAGLANCLSQDAKFRGLDVRPILPTQGPPARDMLGDSKGLVVAQSVPSNVTACYSGLQGEISQRVRRRWYFSGFPENWYVSGAWDFAAHSVALNGLGTILRFSLPGTGGELPAIPCIRHNTAMPSAPPDYAYYQITGWAFSTRASHQRRRSMYQTRTTDVGGPISVPPVDNGEEWQESNVIGDQE
jgi:hypothetical protein